MRVERTEIEGVLLLHPRKHGDARGFLSETFKESAWRSAGIDEKWVQENHSFSAARGVVRGLHFQRPPAAQAKLLRVVRGALFDVALDLRAKSPTYGRHIGVELSAENWTQIYLPIGIAHGFCTLVPETEVIYKMSAEYDPSLEGGVLWNDPDLGIDWPVNEDDAVLSPRDQVWPRFKNCSSEF